MLDCDVERRTMIDQDVSTAERLRFLGLDVDTVFDESLGGHTAVWTAAQAEGRQLSCRMVLDLPPLTKR